MAAATFPLSSLPALSSLPSAAASLYLDFDGHFEAQWGSYRNITIPAFDQDGDPTTFSDGELATIEAIWKSVAEDYAPFNINVTTVEPPSFADGVAMRIAIGGDGAWIGSYGGVSYVDSFTNSITNTAFVFPKNLDNGYWQFVAEASSHEAGHSFGLQHQSQYNAQGQKVAEYYSGPGDGRSPIMGLSYNAVRGLWWYGTSSISATSYQDDMALIARPANGFGYRSDDHGDTVTSATPLVLSGGQASGAGIIGSTADRDYFSFTTGGGPVSFALAVPTVTLGNDYLRGINNLDPVLELRDQADTLLASAGSSPWFTPSISMSDLPAGHYRLVVASHGNYGDVGQYTFTGSFTSAPGTLAAPTNLVAAASGTTQVQLTWTDNADGETGYRVERSLDGATWQVYADLPAESIAYVDTAVTAGTTYSYRVMAYNDTTTSEYSSQATVTIAPAAPLGLAATAVSSSRIDLAWQDVGGETGYRIERSTNGANWALIATTGANVTSYQNTGLAANTRYFYRIQAVNSGGASDYSAVASAVTLALPTVPAAPTNLAAAAASSKRVNLTWRDNSNNETGFIIERSTNKGLSWVRIAQTGAGATSYADTTVSARKTYWYRVRATNQAGVSAPSNVATVTTPRAGAPALPSAAVDAVLHSAWLAGQDQAGQRSDKKSSLPVGADWATLFWLDDLS